MNNFESPYMASRDVHWKKSVQHIALELQRTAIEHELKSRVRSTSPDSSGRADTSTPLSMRASVMLKLAGSKVLVLVWAKVPAARAPTEIAVPAFIVSNRSRGVDDDCRLKEHATLSVTLTWLGRSADDYWLSRTGKTSGPR